VSRTDRDEKLAFSSKKHVSNLLWAILPAGVCLLIAGGLIAFVVILMNGVELKEVIALVVLLVVIGFCVVFVIAFLPTIRLFLFSVRPGNYYLLTDKRLERYTGDGRLVEQIPYSNIERVRLATATSGVDQESRYRLLSIELKEIDDCETLLDRHLHSWSRKNQGHDIALIESFFDMPLKLVYQKIKRRWRMSNGDQVADQDEDRPPP
jgi:hypothetical protein